MAHLVQLVAEIAVTDLNESDSTIIDEEMLNRLMKLFRKDIMYLSTYE